jgi:hypothetical protein
VGIRFISETRKPFLGVSPMFQDHVTLISPKGAKMIRYQTKLASEPNKKRATCSTANKSDSKKFQINFRPNLPFHDPLPYFDDKTPRCSGHTGLSENSFSCFKITVWKYHLAAYDFNERAALASL